MVVCACKSAREQRYENNRVTLLAQILNDKRQMTNPIALLDFQSAGNLAKYSDVGQALARQIGSSPRNKKRCDITRLHQQKERCQIRKRDPQQ